MVPEGKDNVVSRATKLKENQSKATGGGKEYGVPAGQGIMVKPTGDQPKGTGQ
ncbi:hypothetical protein D3C72_2093220 [compost metagenome]